MTELQLYKFIHDNDVESNWRLKQLLAFIPLHLIADFTKMMPYSAFDDGGITVWLKQDYIAIDLVHVCEYFGIEPENIIAKPVN